MSAFLIAWAVTRFVGALLGLVILHGLDEGLWLPPPTPEARFRFLVLCTMLPEVVLTAMMFALWRGR